jgi:hypothetical protein
MTEANNIRSMIAYLLATFNQPETDWNAMLNQHKNVVAVTQRLYNTYNTRLFDWARQQAQMNRQPIPERYEHLSKIQDGLAVAGNLLQQQANQPTGQPTDQPIITTT